METTPVNCNRCGNRVDIGPDTRHVTCAACRTPLVVVRTRTSVFTDVAARQKAMEQIDREWDEEKRQHQVRDKMGQLRTPDEFVDGYVAIGVIIVIAGVVMALASLSGPDWAEFLLMSLVICAVGVLLGGYGWRSARRYWVAEQRYRERRRAVELQPWDDRAA